MVYKKWEQGKFSESSKLPSQRIVAKVSAQSAPVGPKLRPPSPDSLFLTVHLQFRHAELRVYTRAWFEWVRPVYIADNRLAVRRRNLCFGLDSKAFARKFWFAIFHGISLACLIDYTSSVSILILAKPATVEATSKRPMADTWSVSATVVATPAAPVPTAAFFA